MRFSLKSFLALRLIVCSLPCYLPAARSAEYSWQVAGEVERVDYGDSVEIDAVSASATFYVRPVDDTRGPYSLAAFLNRSSRLSMTTTRSEQRSESIVYSPFTNPIRQTLEFESSGYALAGRYVWQDAGWYVGASIDRLDTDWPNSEYSTTDSNVDGYGVVGGKYLGDATALELELNSSTMTLDIMQAGQPDLFPVPLPAIYARTEIETANYGISVFHVGDVGRMAYSVSGQAHSSHAEFRTVALMAPPATTLAPRPAFGGQFISVEPIISPLPTPIAVTQDRIRSYAVAAELFPLVSLGLRAGYARWSNDPTQDSSYELAVTRFFKHSVAARIALSRTKRDVVISSLRHLDSVALEMWGRF